MDTWLAQARDALAAATGIDPAELVCYLVGRAQGTRSLDRLVEAVRSTS